MSNSIKARLLLTITLAQLALMVGFGALAITVLRRELLRSLDTALRGRALSIAALVRYSEDAPHDLLFEEEALPSPLYSPLPDYYTVRISGGRMIAQSNGAASPPDQYRQVTIRSLPIMDSEENALPVRLDVTYASPLAPLQHRLFVAEILIAALGLLLMAGTLTLANLGIQRSLAPLHQLAATAASISPRQWSFQPPASAQLTRELQPLTGALSDAVERLHGSFEQQTEFLGNAAHELKTPVAVLKSTIQMLLQRARSEAEYRAGIQDMSQDVERIERLVFRLLRLARAEHSENQLAQSRPTDLGQTCELAAAQVRRLAEARGVSLYVHCKDLLTVLAEDEDLELIWVNLLENAIRYAASSVSIAMESDGKHATIIISDDGPGVAASELPHIFERFHRGDLSRARQTGGAGLGLAVCRALAEAHGGSISAQSIPGQGFTVTVTLPLASVAAVHEETATSTSQG